MRDDAPREADKSTAQLLRDFADETRKLVRLELALASSELAEKGRFVKLSGGLFGGAALLAIGVFAAVTAAIVAEIAVGLPLWLAALIVAVLYALGAVFVTVSGRAGLRAAAPDRAGKGRASAPATTSNINIRMAKETFARFGADNASTHAAAIAYSTVFAIAPLIIVAVAIAGSVLGVAGGGGNRAVEDQLIGALGSSAGPQTAAMVRTMVDTSLQSHQGSVIAQIVGWVTFVLGASGLFLTLQNAINQVWHVTPNGQGIWLTIRNRIASFGMLLAIGFLLIVTTALNFAVSFLWSHFTSALPFPGAAVIGSVVTWVIDVALIAGLFALMYKYLPDTEVSWGDVKVGSVASAVLFVVGQALLSIYLSHAGISNGYGAVGSLVVLLVWVYYSAMLLLIGAEFTRVYAEQRGSRASKHAAQDADPKTRGSTTHTTEGATV